MFLGENSTDELKDSQISKTAVRCHDGTASHGTDEWQEVVAASGKYPSHARRYPSKRRLGKKG